MFSLFEIVFLLAEIKKKSHSRLTLEHSKIQGLKVCQSGTVLCNCFLQNKIQLVEIVFKGI